ncbi:MAG: hypothetical protein ACO1RA_14040 [Planctomycetaceae bacterium]
MNIPTPGIEAGLADNISPLALLSGRACRNSSGWVDVSDTGIVAAGFDISPASTTMQPKRAQIDSVVRIISIYFLLAWALAAALHLAK